MTRVLYDSTTAADIPAGSQMVAGYIDGSSAWSAADWLRFPGRKLVRICIYNDRFDADVIDIEPGNNDARGSVPWVAGMWSRGRIPIVYCSTDQGPVGYRRRDVIEACDQAGVAHPLFWVALYDGNPAIPPGTIAKQYANPLFTGAHYDASSVSDEWPGVKPMTPIKFAQSKVDVNLVAGEVAVLSAEYIYPPNMTPRVVQWKVYGTTPPGEPRVVVEYPPADPDADPTQDLGAHPSVFVVSVRTP